MTTTERNKSKYQSSQWDFNVIHLLLGWRWVGALVLLLIAAATPAAAADSKEPKIFIPKIANIAGIKVGYSSMGELESRLGKGKVTVGGHSNGARLWRVKGTSWVIYADAFEYSERGAVVDCFEIKMDSKPGQQVDITVDPQPGHRVPYARLNRNGLVWAGGISLGMDEDNLLKLLKRKSWTPAKLADGWLVKAPGHSPLTSDPLDPYNQWEAKFTIKGKSLAVINLNAGVKVTK